MIEADLRGRRWPAAVAGMTVADDKTKDSKLPQSAKSGRSTDTETRHLAGVVGRSLGECYATNSLRRARRRLQRDRQARAH